MQILTENDKKIVNLEKSAQQNNSNPEAEKTQIQNYGKNIDNYRKLSSQFIKDLVTIGKEVSYALISAAKLDKEDIGEAGNQIMEKVEENHQENNEEE